VSRKARAAEYIVKLLLSRSGDDIVVERLNKDIYAATLAKWLADDYNEGAWLQIENDTGNMYLVYDERPGTEYGHQIIIPAKFSSASQFENGVNYGRALAVLPNIRVVKSTGLQVENPEQLMRRKQYLVNYQKKSNNAVSPGTYVITRRKVSTIENSWLRSKIYESNNIYSLYRRQENGRLTLDQMICSELLKEEPIDLSYAQSYWTHINDAFFGGSLDLLSIIGSDVFEGARFMGEKATIATGTVKDVKLEHRLNLWAQKFKLNVNSIKSEAIIKRFAKSVHLIIGAENEDLENEVSNRSFDLAKAYVARITVEDPDLIDVLNMQVMERRSLLALDELGITQISVGFQEYQQILNEPITDEERALTLMTWTGREGLEYARRAAKTAGLESFGNATVGFVFRLGESSAQTVPLVGVLGAWSRTASVFSTDLDGLSKLADTRLKMNMLGAGAAEISSLNKIFSQMILGGMVTGATEHLRSLGDSYLSGDRAGLVESSSDVMLDILFFGDIARNTLANPSSAQKAEMQRFRNQLPDLLNKFEQIMPQERIAKIEHISDILNKGRELLRRPAPDKVDENGDLIIDLETSNAEIYELSRKINQDLTARGIETNVQEISSKLNMIQLLQMQRGNNVGEVVKELGDVLDVWVAIETRDINLTPFEQFLLMRKLGLADSQPYESLNPFMQKVKTSMAEAIRILSEKQDTGFGPDTLVINKSTVNELSLMYEWINLRQGRQVESDLEFDSPQLFNLATKYNWWEGTRPNLTENSKIKISRDRAFLYDGIAYTIPINDPYQTMIKGYLAGLSINEIIKTGSLPSGVEYFADQADRGFVEIKPFDWMKFNLLAEGGTRNLIDIDPTSLGASAESFFVPASILGYRSIIELPVARPGSEPWKFTDNARTSLADYVRRVDSSTFKNELREIALRAVIPEARARGVDWNLEDALDVLADFYRDQVFRGRVKDDPVMQKIRIAIQDIQQGNRQLTETARAINAMREMIKENGGYVGIEASRLEQPLEDIMARPEQLSFEQFMFWTKQFSPYSRLSPMQRAGELYNVQLRNQRTILTYFYEQFKAKYSEPIRRQDVIDNMEQYFTDLFNKNITTSYNERLQYQLGNRYSAKEIESMVLESRQQLMEVYEPALNNIKYILNDLRLTVPDKFQYRYNYRDHQNPDALWLSVLNAIKPELIPLGNNNNQDKIILNAREVIDFIQDYQDLLNEENKRGTPPREPNIEDIQQIMENATTPEEGTLQLYRQFPIYPTLDGNFLRHDIIPDEVIDQNDITALLLTVQQHLDKQNRVVIAAYIALDRNDDLIVTKTEASAARAELARLLLTTGANVPSKYDVDGQPGIDRRDLNVLGIVSSMSFIRP